MNDYLPEGFFTFIGAFLFFLIARSQEITIVLKESSQRTSDEEYRVKRGLRRSLILEIFMFVPVSALLIILITPLLLPFTQIEDQEQKRYAWYTLLGIVSYGFPFAAIKELIIKIALRTLNEYATITSEFKREKISNKEA